MLGTLGCEYFPLRNCHVAVILPVPVCPLILDRPPPAAFSSTPHTSLSTPPAALCSFLLEGGMSSIRTQRKQNKVGPHQLKGAGGRHSNCVASQLLARALLLLPIQTTGFCGSFPGKDKQTLPTRHAAASLSEPSVTFEFCRLWHCFVPGQGRLTN